MAESRFMDAEVVVFDPVAPHLAATRDALRRLGFERIRTSVSFETFQALTEEHQDLVIAACDVEDAPTCEAVRALRAGDTSGNAFAAIVLTAWNRSAGMIRSAMDSGADDVLLRPFSPKTLETRIAAIVRARKGFVVTGDYIGPDRRKDAQRGGGAPLFHPPNTLKACAEGGGQAVAAARAEMAAVNTEMGRERLRRLALRVATAARLRLEGGAKADAMGAEELDRAARELRRRVKAEGAEEGVRLARSLTDVTAAMLGPEGVRADQLALARDLALGAMAAAMGGAEAERLGMEADRLAKAISARLRPKAA